MEVLDEVTLMHFYFAIKQSKRRAFLGFDASVSAEYRCFHHFPFHSKLCLDGLSIFPQMNWAETLARGPFPFLALLRWLSHSLDLCSLVWLAL